MELDMFVPNALLAIEYDGPQHYEFPNPYHRNRAEFDSQCARDKAKDRICAAKGVRLFRVRAGSHGAKAEVDEIYEKIFEYTNGIRF